MANQVLYGFHGLQDIFGERVTDSMIPQINQAIDRTLEVYDDEMRKANAIFAEPTTDHTIRYRSPQAKRLQPATERGRALPTQRAGYYDIGFPINQGMDAFGVDYVTRAKMTVEEVNNWLRDTLVADKRWMRDHMLAALYTNVNYTFVDPEFGNIVVKPLANADADTYLIQTGADAGATADHFLGQAAAIADATNPYPTIRDTLLDHPENGGEVIAFIPSGLRATTEALATFREKVDPNIRPGTSSSVLTGMLDVATPGRLIGYETSGVWIVEWRWLAASRIIAVATEGDRPLGLREDKEAPLRGFKRVGERTDHPWYESQYMRRAGFGARNRVGAVVMEIGDAGYDVPANYLAPIS